MFFIQFPLFQRASLTENNYSVDALHEIFRFLKWQNNKPQSVYTLRFLEVFVSYETEVFLENLHKIRKIVSCDNCHNALEWMLLLCFLNLFLKLVLSPIFCSEHNL